MRLLYRSLAIILICMSASVSAAEDDLSDLRRRLAELEAEQAKSQETIKVLRSEVDALSSETRLRRLPLVEAHADAGDVAAPPSTSSPVGSTIFPELAHESQFLFKAQNGEFSLGIDGTLIGRYELNHRSDDGSGSSNTDQGFQMTGTRINFRGDIYDDFGYWVRFNADAFGDPSIDAALGFYRINEDMTLVAGQFPSLLNREQGIPADKLQVQESSPTNYTFDPFGYKGVMLAYHTPRMAYRGIIGDGYRSLNNSAFDQPSAKWAVAGQVLGLAVGGAEDWPRFDNFTSRPGSGDLAWLLNAAFHLQEGDSHDSFTESSDDLFLGMVESSLEGDGWNLYASGYYRRTNPSAGSRVEDYGFVLLGGVWVAKHLEIYSRFDMTIPDNDRPTQNDNFRTLTAGFNFYPIPHTENIKIGSELLYMFDSEADSIVDPNVFDSVRASPDDNQWVFRTQAALRW
jgi:hypothetical protein